MEDGVDVVIFSTKHVSGEQLMEAGGIVAILKYKVEMEQHNTTMMRDSMNCFKK